MNWLHFTVAMIAILVYTFWETYDENEECPFPERSAWPCIRARNINPVPENELAACNNMYYEVILFTLALFFTNTPVPKFPDPTISDECLPQWFDADNKKVEQIVYHSALHGRNGYFCTYGPKHIKDKFCYARECVVGKTIGEIYFPGATRTDTPFFFDNWLTRLVLPDLFIEDSRENHHSSLALSGVTMQTITDYVDEGRHELWKDQKYQGLWSRNLRAMNDIMTSRGYTPFETEMVLLRYQHHVLHHQEVTPPNFIGQFGLNVVHALSGGYPNRGMYGMRDAYPELYEEHTAWLNENAQKCPQLHWRDYFPLSYME